MMEMAPQVTYAQAPMMEMAAPQQFQFAQPAGTIDGQFQFTAMPGQTQMAPSYAPAAGSYYMPSTQQLPTTASMIAYPGYGAQQTTTTTTVVAAAAAPAAVDAVAAAVEVPKRKKVTKKAKKVTKK